MFPALFHVGSSGGGRGGGNTALERELNAKISASFCEVTLGYCSIFIDLPSCDGVSSPETAVSEIRLTPQPVGERISFVVTT